MELQCPTVNLGDIFKKLKAISDHSTSVRDFLDMSGVEWHSGAGAEPKRFVAAPAVALSAVGGIPLTSTSAGQVSLVTSPSEPLTNETLFNATTQMMAYSGMMSYLNSGHHDEESLYYHLVSRAELSFAHTVSLSFLVAGISTGVENEFNSQRDLVHLSRLTVARTAIQRDPPLVVPAAEMLPAYQKAFEAAQAARKDMHGKGRDFEETANLVFPAAKATAFVMTGTLRNLIKLTEGIDDNGKEREYRDVLHRLRSALASVWPDLICSKEIS